MCSALEVPVSGSIPTARANANTICAGVARARAARPPTSGCRNTSEFAEMCIRDRHGDPGCRQVFEVFLDHSMFDHGGAGVNSDATGTKGGEGALSKDRHGLEPDYIFRAAGGVDFAGGDHGGDSAMQVAVDPADLILPRRPVAGDGMHVAVDQAGCKSCALGVDDESCRIPIDVFPFANGGDSAVDGQDSIGFEDWGLDIAAEEQADVVDQKSRLRLRLWGIVLSHAAHLACW